MTVDKELLITAVVGTIVILMLAVAVIGLVILCSRRFKAGVKWAEAQRDFENSTSKGMYIIVHKDTFKCLYTSRIWDSPASAIIFAEHYLSSQPWSVLEVTAGKIVASKESEDDKGAEPNAST